MIITPKVRGFICTTTHPAGCEANVRQQIDYVRKQGPIAGAPKRVQARRELWGEFVRGAGLGVVWVPD